MANSMLIPNRGIQSALYVINQLDASVASGTSRNCSAGMPPITAMNQARTQQDNCQRNTLRKFRVYSLGPPRERPAAKQCQDQPYQGHQPTPATMASSSISPKTMLVAYQRILPVCALLNRPFSIRLNRTMP